MRETSPKAAVSYCMLCALGKQPWLPSAAEQKKQKEAAS